MFSTNPVKTSAFALYAVGVMNLSGRTMVGSVSGSTCVVCVFVSMS